MPFLSLRLPTLESAGSAWRIRVHPKRNDLRLWARTGATSGIPHPDPYYDRHREGPQ
jgi:hypothetical protein